MVQRLKKKIAKHPMFERFEQAERVVDLLIIVIVVGLGGAMAYGLLTASGSAPWME